MLLVPSARGGGYTGVEVRRGGGLVSPFPGATTLSSASVGHMIHSKSALLLCIHYMSHMICSKSALLLCIHIYMSRMIHSKKASLFCKHIYK